MRARPYLFTLSLLLLAGLAGLGVRGGSARGEGIRRARRIPLVLGDWRGEEEPVPARTREVLGTEDVVFRRYRGRGAEIELAVAAARGDRKVAHPPEVCLRAAGCEILGRRTVAVAGFPEGVVHLPVSREGAESQVVYWYVAAGRSTPSYLGQQIRAAADRLAGRSAPTALVRLSARGKAREVLPDLLGFAALLRPAVERALGDVDSGGRGPGE